MGRGDTNLEAVDHYPNILHYPLPDESYNTLQQHILKGDYRHFDQLKVDKEGLYTHSSHTHSLRLINTPETSILGILHNPMMRIKFLCDGCLRPITTTPFYVCNQGCNFHLHKLCTRLPSELKHHPGHPQHTLVLFHSPPPSNLSYTVFKCNICGLCCNGFGYVCYQCEYQVDVNCGFIPERITHEAHPNHLLSRIDASHIQSEMACNACDTIIIKREFCFRCNFCDFYLDMRCALQLLKSIKHKYDKHPLKLSYCPIEDHKSEYFCEVCEEELIPEKWFYHCQECGQSIHSACAPLILRSEQDVNYSIHDQEGVYKYLNMKFGHSFTFHGGHKHPVSLVVGTKSDACCHFCTGESQSLLIFKCFRCKFAIHVDFCAPILLKKQSTRFSKGILGIFRERKAKKEAFKHFRLLFKREEKRERKNVVVTFYPTEVKRPVTWH